MFRGQISTIKYFNWYIFCFWSLTGRFDTETSMWISRSIKCPYFLATSKLLSGNFLLELIYRYSTTIQIPVHIYIDMKGKKNKNETYNRSARVQVCTISKNFSTISTNFLGLSCSILLYLGLSYLGLFLTILVYLGLSRTFLRGDISKG